MDDLTALRPTLTVMSTNVADTVRNTGGLIFDRARLGWRVTVLVPAGADARPLQILGADVADIEGPCALHRERRNALIAPATLYADDRSIRSELESALATKTTEVLVWGRPLPAGLDRNSRSVSYRLSRAARAFKVQALIAADLPVEGLDPVETFRTRCAPGVLARELDVAG